MSGWRLADVEERAREAPNSFRIPSRQERETLQPGDAAKLIFTTAGDGERMWVLVKLATDGHYVGSLENRPVVIEGLAPGDAIGFGPEHVADLDRRSDA